MPSNLTLSIDIIAANQASAVFNSLSNDIQGFLTGTMKMAPPVAQAVIGIGTAAVAMAASSVNAAQQAQAGFTSLVTGAGESQKNIAAVSQGILKMAGDTGTSVQQLTSGMYQIESAGYHGAAGLSVLRAAAEGAKVGNADLGDTANALTTILTDYHMSGDQAAQAMNGLTATVQAGKLQLSQLTGTMGTVLPLASSLGISFPQVAAGIATMTNAGMDAQRASMDLSNAMRALAAPSGTATKAMASVGLSAQQLKNTLSTQGLTGALQLVEQHVNSTFPAGSVAAVNAFKAIMGGATGYNVALMLGGQNMATYEQNVKNITNAMTQGSGAVTGWAQVQDTFNFQVQRAQAAFQALQVVLGTALLPVLTTLMSWVSDAIVGITTLVQWLQNWGNVSQVVTSAWQGIVDFFTNFGSTIQASFQSLIDAAPTWAQNMVVGFINGLYSMLGAVGQAANDIIQVVAAYLGFASPAKKGPGSHLLEWGANLVIGFANAMTDNASALDDASNELASHIALPGQDSNDNNGTGGMPGTAQSVTTLPTNMVAGVITALSPLASAASTVNGHLNSMCSTASSVSHCVKSSTHTMASTAAKNAAALAKEQAKQAAAAKKAAAAQKAAQAAQVADMKLTAEQQKALSESSSQAVKNLVAKSQAAAKAGNMKLAQYYAQQADSLAAQQKAAADKAAKAAAAAAKKAATAQKTAAKSAGLAGPAPVAPTPAKIPVPQIAAPKDAVSSAQNIAKNVGTAIANGLKGALGKATGVIDAFWARIASSPAARAVIGAWKATTSFLSVAWQKTWSVIGPIVMHLWQTLQQAFGQMRGAVVQIWPALEQLGRAFQVLGQALAVAGQQIWTALAPVLKQLLPLLGQLLPVLKMLGILIGGTLIVALGLLASAIVAVIKGLALFLTGLVQVITGIIQIFSGVIQIVSGVVALIVDLCTGNFKHLGADLGVIWQGIVTMFTGVWHVIQGLFESTIGTIVTIVWGFISTVIGFFVNLYNTLVGHSIIPDLVNGILRWFTHLVAMGVALITTLITNITGLFTNFARAAFSFGQNLINGFIGGINSMLGAVGNAAQNVVQTVANFLKFNSPAKKGVGATLDTWGTGLAQGFANSLLRGAPLINAAASTVMAGVGAIMTGGINATVNGSAPTAANGIGARHSGVLLGAAPVSIGAIHVHLDASSSQSAQQHGKLVADTVKRELAKMLRQQGNAPRFTSGGH